MSHHRQQLDGCIFCMTILVVAAFAANVLANCVNIDAPICLADLEPEEVNETLAYVLSKYEEKEQKIIGEPVGVRGQRLIEGDAEELNIIFQYVDNTPHDILQTCVFIVRRPTQACEIISTVCNSLVPITPRPLLARDDISNCDNGEREPRVDMESEVSTKPDV